jgi:hypothetical protein
MLCSLVEHVKGRNPDMEGYGLNWLFVSDWLCRFSPLVLSRSGSYNIEYLFKYSEVSGLRYACPSHAGIIQQV